MHCETAAKLTQLYGGIVIARQRVLTSRLLWGFERARLRLLVGRVLLALHRFPGTVPLMPAYGRIVYSDRKLTLHEALLALHLEGAIAKIRHL